MACIHVQSSFWNAHLLTKLKIEKTQMIVIDAVDANQAKAVSDFQRINVWGVICTEFM